MSTTDLAGRPWFATTLKRSMYSRTKLPRVLVDTICSRVDVDPIDSGDFSVEVVED